MYELALQYIIPQSLPYRVLYKYLPHTLKYEIYYNIWKFILNLVFFSLVRMYKISFFPGTKRTQYQCTGRDNVADGYG